MVVAPDGEPNAFRLILAEPRSNDLSIVLSVSDDTLAVVTPEIVNVPAGELSAKFELTGFAVGTTALEASPTDASTTKTLPLFVADAFTGDGSDNSKPVGVIVGGTTPCCRALTVSTSSIPPLAPMECPN